MSIALCRACLTENAKMQAIRDTQLHEVYEKLSNSKLITEDGRPDTVCYTCYSQLQRCHNFSVMSQKANKLLKQKYCDGIEISQVDVSTLPESSNSLGSLKNSPVDSQPQDNKACNGIKIECDSVKTELVQSDGSFCDIKIEDTNSNDITSLEASTKKSVKKKKTFHLQEHDHNKKSTTHVDQPQKNPIRKSLYSCDMCFKTFAHNTNLKAHMKIHIGEKLNVCDRCGKSFLSAYQLKRHVRSHTGEKPYKCNFCYRTFSDKGNQTKHVRSHSENNRSFVCTECNASFSQKGNLQRHMRSHTGETPFLCDICLKSLPDASLLKRHMRIHTGEKPYVCNTCGKAYSDKDNYKCHMRRHTGEKPYVCKLCDYKCAYATSLRYHLSKKHSGNQ